MARIGEAQQHQQADFERYQRYLATQPFNRTGGGARVIPVVVHIIQNSQAIEISDARVQSQIDVLNEDFGMYNADTSLIPLEFRTVAASMNIRFCLATIDPNGCPTNGINRVVAPQLSNHGMDDEDALKGYVQWPPQQYLNMWVPRTLKDNLLGYATFPTWLPWQPQYDGVVINGQNFGRGFGTPSSSYNLGRTATHEVGHWLGLYHTFQGGCSGTSSTNCNSQGDQVCDTPPTSGSNYGCPGTINTCTETPADMNDQTMNFMDYTDDACMYMYSQGQGTRSYFFLDNQRSQIWSAANLMATGCDGTQAPGCVPLAQFVANKRVVCVGDTVSFEDRSTNLATSWLWSFQSGQPASSTTQNQDVVWASPGIYEVSLVASNAIGADTSIVTAYVQVMDPNGPIGPESFEQSAVSLPNGWTSEDAHGTSGAWEVINVGSDGQISMRLNNFANLEAGSVNDLLSPSYGSLPSHVIFDYAYRRRSTFASDTFNLDYSTDCGKTWTNVWRKFGPQLATTAGYQSSTEFLPIAANWRSDTVALPSLTITNGIRFRFRGIGGNTQCIYLDHIRFMGLVAATPAQEGQWQASTFPNPAGDFANLALDLSKPSRIKIAVLDALGRKVLDMGELAFPAGRSIQPIAPELWAQLPGGLYFIQLEDGSQAKVLKTVKLRQN